MFVEVEGSWCRRRYLREPHGEKAGYCKRREKVHIGRGGKFVKAVRGF